MVEFNKGKYTNQSLVRGLMLLEQFFSSEEPLGITDLSRMTGFHKSSTHRLVSTLEEVGWLQRTADEKFCFGIKAVVLGRRAEEKTSSLTAIHDLIRILRDEIEETIILTVLTGNDAICIDKATSPQSVACSSKVGERHPIHAGSTGFATILGIEEEHVRNLFTQRPLKRFTAKTVVDVEQLMERYRRDKKQGFTIASGEVDTGITGIAIPIWLPIEKNWGSLGVVLPDYRYDEIKKHQIIEALQQTKQHIQHKIMPGF